MTTMHLEIELASLGGGAAMWPAAVYHSSDDEEPEAQECAPSHVGAAGEHDQQRAHHRRNTYTVAHMMRSIAKMPLTDTLLCC